MTTYNKVILAGIVADDPEYLANSVFGEALRVQLLINRRDIGKIEEIGFWITKDELLSRGLQEIHKDDYLVVTNGRIVTQNYEKTNTLVCPHCQNVTYDKVSAERTDVVALNFDVMQGMDIQESIGINKVFLMGNICTKLIDNPTKAVGMECVKYKIAVSRPYKNTDKKTDFPFIVSFNELAIAARKHFEVSDLVLVEGAIQEREVRQKHPMYCELCKQDVTPITEIDVIEIIASRVARVRLKNGQAGDMPDAEGLGNDYLN